MTDAVTAFETVCFLSHNFMMRFSVEKAWILPKASGDTLLSLFSPYRLVKTC
jgi:hypothetical protein